MIEGKSTGWKQKRFSNKLPIISLVSLMLWKSCAYLACTSSPNVCLTVTMSDPYMHMTQTRSLLVHRGQSTQKFLKTELEMPRQVALPINYSHDLLHVSARSWHYKMTITLTRNLATFLEFSLEKNISTQWTRVVITTSLLRQNDVATFSSNNDVIITSCVRKVAFTLPQKCC